jgi:hypothetical protein
MAMRTSPRGRPEEKDNNDTEAVRQEVIDRAKLGRALGFS